MALTSYAQALVKGKVVNGQNKSGLSNVEVYAKNLGKTVYTDPEGNFEITIQEGETLVFINFSFVIKEQIVTSLKKELLITLEPLTEQLSEVVIDQQKQKIFGIKNLKDVEGTAIYAGKKTEVVLVEQLVSNKASGNPRQAYAQVTGLNILETEDAGLQLNIGGRGLDPNRSSNFNIRQNGYDISADVLGYPESYYTPSLEALDEIQVVKGAASLQYGTQFGGLVNFKLKQPNPIKPFEFISRVGGGSFGLVNVFNSFSGTVDKASYYAFHQYKKGDGFRDNSDFKSHNMYANVGYQFTNKTKLTFESTYLNYLAQQAGGLTDTQFNEDPLFSNRARNYFEVDWVLLNLKLEHEFSSKTNASLNVFRLDASRKSLGFLDNRILTQDDANLERELLIDDFSNWGAEGRILTKYSLFNRDNVFLIGAKYYQSQNDSRQGVGNSGSEADFTFRDEEFPLSVNQKFNIEYPNLNFSVFGENIFKITNNFSVTPGFRLEYIKTESQGAIEELIVGNNGNIIEAISEDAEGVNERSFILLGLGLSYKPSNEFELFGNFSQNYRSITFTDLREIGTVTVDPDLEDETGYTADIGVRGSIGSLFRYDANVFTLLYDNRIGLESGIDDNFNTFQLRSNVGKAQVYGLESLFTANVSNWLFAEKTNFHWQHFLNLSYTYSEFIESSSNNDVEGNEVEFAPEWNIKTGIELGYKNFKSSLQYTFIASQFTDVENNQAGEVIDSKEGIAGEIPAYSVVDFSAAYTYKKWTLEAGINNLLDESYFTRRATGYPGPGIIPSSPRNFYAVLQIKL